MSRRLVRDGKGLWLAAMLACCTFQDYSYLGAHRGAGEGTPADKDAGQAGVWTGGPKSGGGGDIAGSRSSGAGAQAGVEMTAGAAGSGGHDGGELGIAGGGEGGMSSAGRGGMSSAGRGGVSSAGGPGGSSAGGQGGAPSGGHSGGSGADQGGVPSSGTGGGTAGNDEPDGGASNVPVNPCSETVGRGDDPRLYDAEGPSTGTLSLIEVEGRKGTWTFQDDGSGVLTGALGAPGYGSELALHLSTNAALTRWGGLASVPLYKDATTQCAYDASHYSGLAVAIHGTTSFSLGIHTKETLTPPVGSCTMNCQPFLAQLSPRVEWTTHQLRFEDLRQGGERVPSATDLQHLMSIEIVISRTDEKVDLWLDALAFFE